MTDEWRNSANVPFNKETRETYFYFKIFNLILLREIFEKYTPCENTCEINLVNLIRLIFQASLTIISKKHKDI